MLLPWAKNRQVPSQLIKKSLARHHKRDRHPSYVGVVNNNHAHLLIRWFILKDLCWVHKALSYSWVKFIDKIIPRYIAEKKVPLANHFKDMMISHKPQACISLNQT